MTETNSVEKKEDVDLYNPKFVHFDWDEALRGKTVFYCDNIVKLQHMVRVHYRDKYHEIEGHSDFGYPFRISGSDWQFAYYDPNYEVKWAYFKEGKVIQIRREGCEWFDVVGHYDPEFFDGDDRYEFRIKPKEEPKPNVEVNVDVKVNNTSSDNKIKIAINGKECVFENVEQARMVLKG